MVVAAHQDTDPPRIRAKGCRYAVTSATISVSTSRRRVRGAGAPGPGVLGRGQAVRRRPLEPVFEGSNPSAPTSLVSDMRPTGFGELKVFSGSAHPQLAA